jgi:large repetitive protein
VLLGLLGLPTGPPDARVFYLVAPNQGYFLETSYAGLGHFEPQTGAPFSNASFNGTYVIGTIPASSLASINSSGYTTADGAGHATYTLDENLGVGTLNVLQLGVTGTTTYSLSDNNANVTPATAGRYLLGDGTTVIYAISPGRFVLVDTNALTTSPGVSLAY